MKLTTRLRILSHFRKYQAASVRELSQIMGMTGANIRHHLAVLETNDLIEVIGFRKEGRGRPMQVYGLSRRVMGDGLDNLSSAMLELWMDDIVKEEQTSRLQSIARRLSGATFVTFPMREKLVRTIEFLNELHYQAHWEASATGPRLILGNCPYAAIIGNHPELCQVDSNILFIKIGLTAEQTVKLQVNSTGLRYCSFIFGE